MIGMTVSVRASGQVRELVDHYTKFHDNRHIREEFKTLQTWLNSSVPSWYNNLQGCIAHNAHDINEVMSGLIKILEEFGPKAPFWTCKAKQCGWEDFVEFPAARPGEFAELEEGPCKAFYDAIREFRRKSKANVEAGQPRSAFPSEFRVCQKCYFHAGLAEGAWNCQNPDCTSKMWYEPGDVCFPCGFSPGAWKCINSGCPKPSDAEEWIPAASDKCGWCDFPKPDRRRLARCERFENAAGGRMP